MPQKIPTKSKSTPEKIAAWISELPLDIMPKRRLQKWQMPPNDIEYLTTMPEEVPAGKILLHNNVVPAKRIGSQGFRIWFASPDAKKYVVCDCGWAPEVGEHYRINTDA